MSRFWGKVKITSLYSCWEWQAGIRNEHGYGAFWLNQRQIPAHRAAYEMVIGQIPKNLDLLHSCNNRRCVHPLHLRPGTAKENAADRIKAGTHYVQKGEQHWNAKLTDFDVADIRAAKETQQELATKFGVNQATISKIKARLRRQ